METLKELANTTQRLLLAGVALAVGWILGVALSSVPLASAVGCDVEPPNYGSNGADSLYDDLDGEAERNQWYLGQGRDHGSAYFCSDIAVNGEGDNDEMYGGEAVDNVGGGAGRDLVAGNDDDDDVDGGNGDDVLRDSANQDGDIDVLAGGSDDDDLDTVDSDGLDLLLGGAGNDGCVSDNQDDETACEHN